MYLKRSHKKLTLIHVAVFAYDRRPWKLSFRSICPKETFHFHVLDGWKTRLSHYAKSWGTNYTTMWHAIHVVPKVNWLLWGVLVRIEMFEMGPNSSTRLKECPWIDPEKLKLYVIFQTFKDLKILLLLWGLGNAWKCKIMEFIWTRMKMNFIADRELASFMGIVKLP